MRSLTVWFVRLGARFRLNRRGQASSKEISMRRLFVMVAFGFGFYYLWNNTDTTVEWMAVGAMGVALLLEFAGAE
jgi:hypothetical protein